MASLHHPSLSLFLPSSYFFCFPPVLFPSLPVLFLSLEIHISCWVHSVLLISTCLRGWPRGILWRRSLVLPLSAAIVWIYASQSGALLSPFPMSTIMCQLVLSSCCLIWVTVLWRFYRHGFPFICRRHCVQQAASGAASHHLSAPSSTVLAEAQLKEFWGRFIRLGWAHQLVVLCIFNQLCIFKLVFVHCQKKLLLWWWERTVFTLHKGSVLQCN